MEQKQFNKTRELTKDEFKDLLVQAQGKALKLNDFPDNTHIVAKIVAEPKVRKYPTDDTDENGNILTKDIPYFSIEYKWDEKRIPMLLRTSLGSYNKFKQNNEGKDYLNKYAIFTKANVDKKNMHSIGVIYKEGFEPLTFVNPLDVLNKEPTAPVVEPEKFNPAEVQKWVNNYKNSVKQFNELVVKQGNPDDVREVTLESCSYQYFRKHYEEEFKVIAEMFR